MILLRSVVKDQKHQLIFIFKLIIVSLVFRSEKGNRKYIRARSLEFIPPFFKSFLEKTRGPYRKNSQR